MGDVTWTCSSCGRTEALPPKWCGCEPYPITAEELAGVVDCYAIAAGRQRAVEPERFESLVAEHHLVLRTGAPRPPALVRRVTTAGIEVAVSEEHEWAPLSPALAAALGVTGD